MLSGGFVLHGIAYLELAPNEYLCNGTPCTAEEFCAQPSPSFTADSIDYTNKVDGEPNENVFNWYTKLGLVCSPDKKRQMAMIATLALLGVSISCLFVPRMGDLYGRKPIYAFALAL